VSASGSRMPSSPDRPMRPLRVSSRRATRSSARAERSARRRVSSVRRRVSPRRRPRATPRVGVGEGEELPCRQAQH
jgi:hypothetical protein